MISFAVGDYTKMKLLERTTKPNISIVGCFGIVVCFSLTRQSQRNAYAMQFFTVHFVFFNKFNRTADLLPFYNKTPKIRQQSIIKAT